MPLLLYEIENGLLSRPARLAARLLYLTVHSVLTDRYIQVFQTSFAPVFEWENRLVGSPQEVKVEEWQQVP